MAMHASFPLGRNLLHHMYQVGKSLVFMRQGAEKVLEKARAKALSRIAILVGIAFLDNL